MSSDSSDEEHSLTPNITEVNSQQRLDSILHAIPHGVQENDLNGTITYSNTAHHRMLGYEPGEIVGKKIWDLNHSHDGRDDPNEQCEREALKQYFAYLVNEQPAPTPYVCYSRRKDGSALPTQVDWTYQRDADGNLTGFASIISDISDRLQSEKALSESHRYFQSLDLIWRALAKSNSIDDVLQKVAEEMLSIFNCDRAWFLYPCDPESPSWKVLVEATTPDFPGAFELHVDIPTNDLAIRVFKQALTSNASVFFDISEEHLVHDPIARFEIKTQIVMALRPKVGKPWLLGLHQCRSERQWSESEKTLLQDIGLRITDSITNFVLYQQLRDELSERLMLEKRVRAERDQAQHYLDVVQVMMLVLDLTGRIILINGKACEVLGYEQDQIIGQDWFSLCIPKEERAEIRRVFEQVMEGELDPVEHYENNVLTKAGDKRLIAWHNSRQIDLDGNITGVLTCGEDITEFRQAEIKLKKSEASLAEAQRIAKTGNWELNLMTNELSWSDEVYRIFEISQEAFGASYEAFMDLVHPDDREYVNKAYTDATHNKRPYNLEHRLLLEDGSVKYVHEKCETYYDGTGTPVRSFGTVQDISERKRMDEELQLHSLVLKNSSEGMLVTDADNRIIAINPAFSAITGYSANEVIGQDPKMFSSGRHGPEFYEAMWQELNESGRWQGELWDKRKNGKVYAKWLTINTIRNDDGTVHRYVALFSDMTEKKMSEELIWKQANFDSLTNLPNRNMLQDRLSQEVVKCGRDNLSLALLLIDLDQFKEINDTLGHDSGDALLIESASRIVDCVRESDTVARLGGDEFSVILSELPDDSHVEVVAQKIIKELARPFDLNGEELYVSASIGITMFPADSRDIFNLIKNADQAMYAAKAKGRNRFSYFTQSLQDAAQTRLRLINDLRKALERKQFSMVFQPIVDLETGRIKKAEALVRWIHPERGKVSPLDFIPAAEDTGLILEIGDWIFKESARWVARWCEMYGEELQVSINLSPIQFRGEGNHYSDAWLEYVQDLGIKQNNIVIEITESLLLNADTDVVANLDKFHHANMQVAIDDFGTGYSSLSYLKKFDIDYLKIDQSFTRNIENSDSDMALSEAIIVMSHKLGLKVIAEGVETEGQRDLLADAGCDFAQGYLYSHPVPPQEFEAQLKDECDGTRKQS